MVELFKMRKGIKALLAFCIIFVFLSYQAAKLNIKNGERNMLLKLLFRENKERTRIKKKR